MQVEELIQQAKDFGTHVLVYAGNGSGKPAELLFGTRCAAEGKAIGELLARLLEARKSK